MSSTISRPFALLALILLTTPVVAQDESWLGKRIITKFGSLGLVDTELDGTTKVVARLGEMLYTVEAEDGDQIKLRQRGVTGWVAKSDVVLVERAVAYYSDLLKQNPADSVAFAHRGSAWNEMGEHRQALKDYDAAVELQPNETAWRNNRAFIRRHLREYDQAIEDYNAALKIDPENVVVLNNRGNAYREKKDYDKAITDYDEALKLDPDMYVARNNRGNAYREKKEYDKAFADFAEVLMKDPTYVLAYLSRGQTWVRKGDYVKAHADFEEALRQDPKHAPTFNAQAWLWATSRDAVARDGRRAVAAARTACELTAWKRPHLIDTLAAAHAEAGDFDDAVRWQRRALELATAETEREPMRRRLQLYEKRQPFRDE